MNSIERERILGFAKGKILIPCSICGQENAIQFKFCNQCGTSLADAPNKFFEVMEKPLESYAKQFHGGAIANISAEEISTIINLVVQNLRQIQNENPSAEQASREPQSQIVENTNASTPDEQMYERFRKEHPNVSRAEFTKTLETLKQRQKCPMCGGFMVRMDAGGRGKAFGQGNLLGAFAKTYRCHDCGYLV